MYLISLYFDEKIEKTIQQLIDKVAEKSGNKYMIEGRVPPHITISAFETEEGFYWSFQKTGYIFNAGFK